MVGLVVLSMLVFIRMVLPFALEWAIPRIAASQGLVVQVGNIDLGLIVGEVTLEDLIIDLPRSGRADEVGSKGVRAENLLPLASLDRLYVAFEWTDLFFKKLHVTAFELDHPVIEVTQLADGSLALPAPEDADESDLSEPDLESEFVADADAEDSGWEFMLDRFVLKDPDFGLHSESAGEEVVRLAADGLGFDDLSIGQDGIGLGGIDLDHPELFVQREWLLGGGGVEDAPELDTEPTSSPNDSDPTPAELPSLRIKHLKIEGAAFTVRTAEGPVEVALGVELTDVGTQLEHRFPVHLGLQIDEAEIGVDGELGLNPVSFTGQFNWRNLSVPPFLLLAYPKVVPWLASCRAQGELEIAFSSVRKDKPAGLSVSGSSSVLELSFKHPETGELALEWDALEIDLQEAFVPLEPTSEDPIRVGLSRVALVSPRIVYTNPPDALNDLLAALENETVAEDSAGLAVGEAGDMPQPNSGSQPSVMIEKLELTDGTLRYVNRSVEPTHETRITQLRVEMDGLTATPIAGVEKVLVDGLIQKAGSFALRGALPGGEGNLHFELRQLDLVSYDALARAAGWQVESGLTSLVSDIVASRDGIATKNELVLHDLDVAPDDGSGFASRFGMSVDVVLALLRDPSGDIPLSIPVSFDEAGAGVDVGPILASAMRNALTGAIASPLKMLGMLVPTGGRADSFGAVHFAPGQRELDSDARAQIEALAEFVKSRPMLGLSLDGHWSEQDRLPTAQKILEETAASGGEFPELEGVGFFDKRRIAAALRDRVSGEKGELAPEDEALLENLIAAQKVSEERLNALAAARAASIGAALRELDVPREALSLGPATIAEGPSVTLDLDSRPESSSAPAPAT